MSALLELARYGQDYWIDDLTRTMIKSGELARRVTEEGLTGVTSNPAIFNAAISKSADYDRQIAELSAQPPSSIYEALIVTDVRDACDILRPVYDRTEGRDGFVSLEVSPRLARDAQGSIAEARRFWQAVARPNLFIKIPGTPEGVPVIEALLVEGINVNITLLFSIERYEAVAFAYLRALERRHADQAPIDRIASVASFFLSRIDTLVDKLLQDKTKHGHPEAARLLGKCAIANARLAYQRYEELASSVRWRSLDAAGARPQRLLWASTSAKNPAYDDLMYVEPLIGPQTINTMPQKTIKAFAQHGEVAATLEQGLDEAREVMNDLEKIGIDLSRVTERLLDEGIGKFVEPFDELLKTIAQRAKKPSGARGPGATR